MNMLCFEYHYPWIKTYIIHKYLHRSYLGISETSKLLLWCVSDLVQYKRSDQIYKKMRLTVAQSYDTQTDGLATEKTILCRYYFPGSLKGALVPNIIRRSNLHNKRTSIRIEQENM